MNDQNDRTNPLSMTLSSNHIPLRDFFRNPERTSYRISPDGTYLALMMPHLSRMNVFVQKRGTEELVRVTAESERDVAAYFWKGNTTILYLKDNHGDENFGLMAVECDGSNPRPLTLLPGVKTEIIDELEDHPTDILIATNKRDPAYFDAYRLDTSTGQMTLIAQNPGTITGWLADHDGRVRVAVSTDGVETSLLYRESEREGFRVVKTTTFRDTFTPLFFTFDNRDIYVASNLERDRTAIVRFDPRSAEVTEMICDHPEVDIASLHYSRLRKVLTSATYITWKREIMFFDEPSRLRFERICTLVTDSEITYADSTRDEKCFVIRTFSDRSLGAYYLFDEPSDTLTKLSDVCPWFEEEKLCEMKPISLTSRDGMTLHGYLTLPNSVSPTHLPIVVHPHGGPWHRDTWGFDPIVQFLANRGYGVLQINFRGSTGYGREFWEASFKQWGKKMQDDITDAVHWAIGCGIADPKRIAIFGGSYGGYATLCGLTFTPEIYACGIDYVGVSNLFTFMNSIPPYWTPYRKMMYEMIGDPTHDRECMMEASPVFYVENIRAPLLVAQGAMDPRVNVNESNQIVDALRARGVEVEYIVKENEGHGFHNEENRFEFFEAMERFLAKHLS